MVMKEYIKKYWKYLKREGKICLNDLKHIKTVYKQIPNILTILRLLSTIPINIFFFTGNIVASLITCAFAAFTDAIDGQFARNFKCTSQFGADLDAICDKLFIILMALPIVIQNPFMLLNLGLEFGIVATNVNAAKEGKKVKSSRLGKVKTWVLSATVLLGYLFPLLGISPNLLSSFLITLPAAILQTTTLLKYIETNNSKNIEKPEETIIQPTKSLDVIKENNQKQLSKNYSHPVTVKELKEERDKLLQKDNDKGYQKTKTDLK